MAVQAGFEDLSLLVIVPRGGGECREFELTADPKDTGAALKRKIEKASSVPADDLELFAKNSDDEGAKQSWIKDDETLESQNVRDGAVITVGVHGMKGDVPEEDSDGGEMPNDAVRTSIYSKGDASYYHAHRRKGDELPEELRVVSGGSPQKLGESDVPLPEPTSPGRSLAAEGAGAEGARPERRIAGYSWGDESGVVKIYVEEPEAVQAAGDGKSGQVEVEWRPRYLKLRVHAERIDLVLEIDRIYYDIVPEECRWRVSAGKRVTLTLKKKEAYTWLKLVKPEL